MIYKQISALSPPLRKTKLAQISVSYKTETFWLSNDLLPLNLNEYSNKGKKDFFVILKNIYLNDNRLLVDMIIG